jgi:hypothetical protein
VGSYELQQFGARMSSSLTSTSASTASRIAFLDVARCFAALLVLAEHVMDILFPDFQKSTVGYARRGQSGRYPVFCYQRFYYSLQPAARRIVYQILASSRI